MLLNMAFIRMGFLSAFFTTDPWLHALLFVCRLVSLPASTTFDDLLGKAAATAKKGAMKTAAGASGNAGGSRVGQTKHITDACHLADGKPLSLVLQVRANASLQIYHINYAV
jgi:hypothetical protein